MGGNKIQGYYEFCSALLAPNKQSALHIALLAESLISIIMLILWYISPSIYFGLWVKTHSYCKMAHSDRDKVPMPGSCDVAPVVRRNSLSEPLLVFPHITQTVRVPIEACSLQIPKSHCVYGRLRLSRVISFTKTYMSVRCGMLRYPSKDARFDYPCE